MMMKMRYLSYSISCIFFLQTYVAQVVYPEDTRGRYKPNIRGCSIFASEVNALDLMRKIISSYICFFEKRDEIS